MLITVFKMGLGSKHSYQIQERGRNQIQGRVRSDRDQIDLNSSLREVCGIPHFWALEKTARG
jgi:hypothetical protein